MDFPIFLWEFHLSKSWQKTLISSYLTPGHPFMQPLLEFPLCCRLLLICILKNREAIRLYIVKDVSNDLVILDFSKVKLNIENIINTGCKMEFSWNPHSFYFTILKFCQKDWRITTFKGYGLKDAVTNNRKERSRC